MSGIFITVIYHAVSLTTITLLEMLNFTK